MAVIGNSSTQQAFTPAVDYFSGNASTTAFTLSRPVASVAQVQVVVNNVAQNPSSAYTISSNTITFTSAPSSGTNNIYVYYTSPITDVIAPGQGTVTATSMASSTGTGAGVFQTSPTITTPVISSLSSASATALTLQSAGTTAITVDASQRVGIGTASPSALLHVSSTSAETLRFQSTSSAPYQSFYNSSANRAGYMEWNTSAFKIDAESGASSTIAFLTANTERMRIDSSGNVGIGTTSLANKLTLNSGFVQTGNGVGGAGGVWLPTSTASTDCRTWRVRTDIAGYGDFGIEQSTTQNGTTFATKFLINQTGQVGINVNPAAGNTFRVVAISSDNSVQFGTSGAGVYLGNGATSFSTYSDTRLKNITGRYEAPLEDIAKLDAIKFTWKNDTENKPCVGVSAQSVETVIPEAIDRGTNFNAEGDATEYLSVRYTEIIPLLVASIKELSAKNDALTARIEALENK